MPASSVAIEFPFSHSTRMAAARANITCEITWVGERGLPPAHRRTHPGGSAAQRTDPVRAGSQPRDQPERGGADRAGPAEPQPGDARTDRRGARQRVRQPRPLRADPPAHRRWHEAAGADRGQDVQERGRRPAVRVAAQPRTHDAAPPGPHRGGQPDHRGAHLDRSQGPVAAGLQRRGDPAATTAGPGAHRRRGGPADAHRHHVSWPADARPRHLPAPVCRWVRPGDAHRRAAHGGAALVRSRRGHHPRVLLGHGIGPRTQQVRRAHRAGRHGHRERAHGCRDGCPARR